MSISRQAIHIREYQEKGASALIYHVTEGGGGMPVMGYPTGTGKTMLFNYCIKRLCDLYRHTRVLVVTDDATIIDQNADAMLRLWPSAPVGVYSAGLGRKDTHAQILYGGVQSLFRKAEILGAFDFLFIDEAHMVSDKETSMYQKLIAGLRLKNPNLWIVGFSATPYRMGMGMLTDGKLFDFMLVDMTGVADFMFFIDQGYLCRLVTKRPKIQLDLHEVKMVGNEFDQKQLADVSDTDALNTAVVDECLAEARERRHWLGFATSVKHATNLVAKFSARGITAEIVHGEMKHEDRKPIMDRFHTGRTRCVVNVGVLSKGYDFPALDMIFVVRGTQSTNLWVQMLGRGTRPFYAPGYDLLTQAGRLAAIDASSKKNCLVLDFAGNVPRLGPINDPMIPKPRKKGQPMGGEAPYKVCAACDCYNHTRAVVCKECGAEFPPPSTLEGKAGTHEVMVEAKEQPVVEEFDVMSWTIVPGSTKQMDRPCIKVSYMTIGRCFRKTIVMDPSLQGMIHISGQWWKAHGGQHPHPESQEEFMSRIDELTRPLYIHVITNRPYPDIVGYYMESHTA